MDANDAGRACVRVRGGRPAGPGAKGAGPLPRSAAPEEHEGGVGGVVVHVVGPGAERAVALPRRRRPALVPHHSANPCGERSTAGSGLIETGPLSQGVQAGKKPLKIRHNNSMEVRKKRPRGFKKRPRGFK